MGKIGLATCLLWAMILFEPVCDPALAQEQPSQNQYIEINYMKVQPGQEPEYLRLESELWKPIHQARVNSGLILSWKLCAVYYPGGSDSDPREHDALLRRSERNSGLRRAERNGH